MSENPYASLKIRDWDTLTKVSGIVALLAGGLWAVWVNHQTAEQQASSARIDAQKPFSGKRLEIYDKLATLTAFVAQTDLPPSVRKSKRQELDQLVNGPLALVAQEKVFVALLDFYRCLDDRACKKGSLALYSRNVARACRASIEESWNVKLPPVPSSDKLP
jgi:hypothetical protein